MSWTAQFLYEHQRLQSFPSGLPRLEHNCTAAANSQEQTLHPVTPGP